MWLLWQLVQEIVAIRPDGSVLPPGDPNHAIQKAQVAWDGPGHYSSGAWVNYVALDWLFPSDTYSAYQKDFAAGAAAALADSSEERRKPFPRPVSKASEARDFVCRIKGNFRL